MNAYNPLRTILFVIISIWYFASYAQFQFIYNDSLPIIKLGNTLKYPWAGGLNFSQFSELDFDYDGDDHKSRNTGNDDPKHQCICS